MKNLAKNLTALAICGALTLGFTFDKVEAAQVSGTFSPGSVTISVNTDKDSRKSDPTPPNPRYQKGSHYRPDEPHHNPATPSNRTPSKHSSSTKDSHPDHNNTPNNRHDNNSHDNNHPNNNRDNGNPNHDNYPNKPDNSRNSQRW